MLQQSFPQGLFDGAKETFPGYTIVECFFIHRALSAFTDRSFSQEAQLQPMRQILLRQSHKEFLAGRMRRHHGWCVVHAAGICGIVCARCILTYFAQCKQGFMPSFPRAFPC